MRYLIVILSFFCIFFSCKKTTKEKTTLEIKTLESQKVQKAKGFSIRTYKNHKEITVYTPWPEAKDSLHYILYPKGASRPERNGNFTFIEVPIERVIVTATTDIPMLEYLNIEDRLVGFPNTDYISSEKTRQLIDSGKVKNLGNENNLNVENVLASDPELVIGFATTPGNKSFDLLKKSEIPVVINSSWLESHPLGRAEWIKFVAAFFGKEKEARTIFTRIEKEYTEAASLVKTDNKKPTAISGNMYKDIWYLPGGNSFMAQLFEDAQIDYLWSETEKTGSLSLNFENVLETGQSATLWIGAGNARSLNGLQNENAKYNLFEAFKNKNVYSSSLKTGKKGGSVYYELGPMRPDLILKDFIKIAHPEFLTDYELYFFKKLE